MVVRKAQIVQLVEVRSSFYKGERAWHELQLRTGTIFNRLPRLFFGSPAEVDHRITHKEYAMNRFLHASAWQFLLTSTIDSGQWTIDNETAYLQIPDSLKPSAWQFLLPIAFAVPYCLVRLP